MKQQITQFQVEFKFQLPRNSEHVQIQTKNLLHKA